MPRKEEKRKIIVLGTHYPGSDTFREIWAELSKKARDMTTEEIKNEQTHKKRKID